MTQERRVQKKTRVDAAAGTNRQGGILILQDRRLPRHRMACDSRKQGSVQNAVDDATGNIWRREEEEEEEEASPDSLLLLPVQPRQVPGQLPQHQRVDLLHVSRRLPPLRACQLFLAASWIPCNSRMEDSTACLCNGGPGGQSSLRQERQTSLAASPTRVLNPRFGRYVGVGGILWRGEECLPSPLPATT